MKLGDVKLEALKVMNINNDEILLLENIDRLIGEKKYAKYLNNMFNSINKAIDIINHRNIIKQKVINMADLLTAGNNFNNKFDLSLIKDFLSINRIVFDNQKYVERVPYDKIGNVLVISNKFNPTGLNLVYNPKAINITEDTSNADEIEGLDDELARLIPYYIKFDLYQEDEPNLAINAKNTFDQGIESLRTIDNEQDEFIIEAVYTNED